MDNHNIGFFLTTKNNFSLSEKYIRIVVQMINTMNLKRIYFQYGLEGKLYNDLPVINLFLRAVQATNIIPDSTTPALITIEISKTKMQGISTKSNTSSPIK